MVVSVSRISGHEGDTRSVVRLYRGYLAALLQAGEASRLRWQYLDSVTKRLSSQSMFRQALVHSLIHPLTSPSCLSRISSVQFIPRQSSSIKHQSRPTHCPSFHSSFHTEGTVQTYTMSSIGHHGIVVSPSTPGLDQPGSNSCMSYGLKSTNSLQSKSSP